MVSFKDQKTVRDRTENQSEGIAKQTLLVLLNLRTEETKGEWGKAKKKRKLRPKSQGKKGCGSPF